MACQVETLIPASPCLLGIPPELRLRIYRLCVPQNTRIRCENAYKGPADLYTFYGDTDRRLFSTVKENHKCFFCPSPRLPASCLGGRAHVLQRQHL